MPLTAKILVVWILLSFFVGIVTAIIDGLGGPSWAWRLNGWALGSTAAAFACGLLALVAVIVAS